MTDNKEEHASRENMWDQQWPSPTTETSHHGVDELDTGDELSPYPDSVGTSEVIESVRDAEPYTPPIDPPVLPGGRDGIHVATGFGTSAEEVSVLEDVPRGDEDLREEVMMVLSQDSLTSQYRLQVAVRNGIVHLVGPVTSTEDAEYAATMVDNLPGVVDVVDDTTLESTGA